MLDSHRDGTRKGHIARIMGTEDDTKLALIFMVVLGL